MEQTRVEGLTVEYYNTKVINRKVYLDYLRVYSALAVIILHVSAQNWYSTDVNGFAWQVFNFTDSLVRWAAPSFIMISGSLFLAKEIPLKTIYFKYIFRMVIAFVIWAFIYFLFTDGSYYYRILLSINGHYHMWFIMTIIGLYMCLPIIRPIVATDTRMKYFITLSFCFAFLIPQIIVMTNDFGSDLGKEVINTFNKNVKDMNLQFVLGYVSYFVLGYYLDKRELNKKQRTIIYVLGFLGAIFTIEADRIVAIKNQMFCDNYYDNFRVNVLLETIAVFTFFKYKEYKHLWFNNIMLVLSKLSFGAFLVHPLIIEQLKIRCGLHTLSYNALLAVLGNSVLVFSLSFSISAILNQIPLIKKYMV